MNNCTVFKLESSLDVVAPKFGFIPFVVTQDVNFKVRYKGIGKVYIMESNGSYFTVGSDTAHKTETTLATTVETTLHVSTANGCTVCLDREQIAGISSSHTKINLDDLYGSSIRYLFNYENATFGNIINLINGQGLDTFYFTSSLVTGEVKEFVEKAEQEGCTYVSYNGSVNLCQIHTGNPSQISFDGITYQDYFIKKEDGLVKVATDREFTNILGSYNGSSWS